ncbi:uncharacterized protein DS421_5g139400 [Arachis hypogaea]|nr:uncharacterized protein DS421_5g139400 [Arachis hypogaea]
MKDPSYHESKIHFKSTPTKHNILILFSFLKVSLLLTNGRGDMGVYCAYCCKASLKYA